jgi:hypothetical protein
MTPPQEDPTVLPLFAQNRTGGPNLFTLGAVGGFLGAMVVVGLPLLKRGVESAPCDTGRPVPVFEPELRKSIQTLTPPSESEAGEKLPHGMAAAALDSFPRVSVVEDLDETVGDLRDGIDYLPVAFQPSTADVPEEKIVTRFVTGEIVRKGKDLRRSVLAPSLGVVTEVFTSTDPFTYKVTFFDGEDSRRDIYWDEDLVKLNPMERDLFLSDYPEEVRDTIRNMSVAPTG